MNIAETLRGLLRRWYVLIPGLLLAAVAAGCLWTTTPPTYQRSASQLLLPAEATLPEVEIKVKGGKEGETETLAPNPFLYLGGLNTACDVLISAVRGAPAVAAAAARHEGSEITVARDPLSSGPMLLVTVTAGSDEAAAALIDTMLDETARVLDEIQTTQHVPDRSRIMISPIAVDAESTLGIKDRMMMAGGAGVGGILLTVLLAAGLDGLLRGRGRRVARRRGRSKRMRAAEPIGVDRRRSMAQDADPAEDPAGPDEPPAPLVLLPVVTASDDDDRDDRGAAGTDPDPTAGGDADGDADLPHAEAAPVGARASRR